MTVRAFTSYKNNTNMSSGLWVNRVAFKQRCRPIRSVEFRVLANEWWRRWDCSQSQFYEEIKMTRVTSSLRDTAWHTQTTYSNHTRHTSVVNNWHRHMAGQIAD